MRIIAITSVLLLATVLHAEPPTPFQALERMPVKEVTVFKDGHAFVLHEGKMPVGEDGTVAMDYLPTPIIGTFWAYSSDENVPLVSTTASQHKVLVDRTALNLAELIEANVGAEVVVTEPRDEGGDLVYRATILEFPKQTGEEQEGVDIPYSGDKLTQKGNVVLLKTEAGTKVVNLEKIRDIAFTGDYRKVLPREEMRNLLTLRLGGNSQTRPAQADVGLLYLQQGIRWIPSYRITLDGKGNAAVKLQATLVNELADLQDVRVNLVVGVPSFKLKDTLDPIGLQQTLAQVEAAGRGRIDLNISNAYYSQVAAAAPASVSREGERDLGPEVAASGSNEELYIFNVEHITLRKGERMVFPVTEFTIPYENIYRLEVPYAPPAELMRNANFNSEQQSTLARLMEAPKVMHKIRLHNQSDFPLTTAPALILNGKQLLAQGMTMYGAPGADVDVDITAAVDVVVEKTDTETKRTPNAATWQGDEYGRVDLAGTIRLTNYRNEPMKVEVVRRVLGNVDSAAPDGKIEMVNVFEDTAFADAPWRPWVSWPWWWGHFNGIGRITWTIDLQPKQPSEVTYTWNYYWR